MLAGLVSVLAGHLIQMARWRAYAVAFYAATAASLLIALAFALVALRHWIAVAYASEYPDLWIAGGFVVLAIPLASVGAYLHARKPKANPAADLALLAAPSLLGLAARGMRKVSPRAVGIGVVLIVAVVLGRGLFSRPPSDDA